MAGIGVVVNKNAGQKRTTFRGNIGKKLGFVLGDPESLRETSRVEDLDEVVRVFRDRRVEILGIGGGDGSNHYTLDTLVRTYGAEPLPRVAFLCGGTHNAHALSVGVQGTPEKLLQGIVHKYHTRADFETTHRLLLRIDDGVRIHHGFTLASGFMYRFYEELILRQGDSPAAVALLLAGWVASLAIGGRRIRGLFAREPARITVGDAPLPGWTEVNGITASGMERLGLGFKPYPRASEHPNTFQLGVLRIQPEVFLKLMYSYRRGVVPIHEDAFSDTGTRLVVEAEQPIAYVLDGELYRGGTRLEITSGPRIEIIVS